MSDIVFYTNPMSRGRVARWMLEEIGEPYETVVLDYATTMKDANYRAINPMGKVPAITHRGAVVTETPAICAYLADAFPDAGLAPPPAGRADYYRWLFFASGPFEAAVIDKMRQTIPPPEMERMVGYGTLAATLDTLDAMLGERDYVAGDRFSASDLYLSSQIGWQIVFGTIEARPAFASYVKRCTARPAFARVAEMDGPTSTS